MVLTLFLLGCESSVTPPSVPSNQVQDCETADGLFPQEGSSIDNPRGWVTVDFTAVDESAVIEVAAAGVAVEGAGQWIGQTLVWEPVEPLPADTMLEATVSFCAGNVTRTWSFTTGPELPAVEPAELLGMTWAIRLDGPETRHLEPIGGGDLLVNQLPGAAHSLLLTVTDVDGDELRVTATQSGSTPPMQDLCVATTGFSLELLDNPRFEAGPIDLNLEPVTYRDAELSGTVTSAGLVDVVLRATSDLREAPGVDGCSLIESFGISCVTCADGELACLPRTLHRLTGKRVTTPVIERTAAQIAGEPDCAP